MLTQKKIENNSRWDQIVHKSTPTRCSGRIHDRARYPILYLRSKRQMSADDIKMRRMDVHCNSSFSTLMLVSLSLANVGRWTSRLFSARSNWQNDSRLFSSGLQRYAKQNLSRRQSIVVRRNRQSNTLMTSDGIAIATADCSCRRRAWSSLNERSSQWHLIK